MPVKPDRKDGRCVEPFKVTGRPIVDLGHTGNIHKAQYADGKMNGFISAFAGQRGVGDLAMGYYDDGDIPYYWNVADNYVLFDRAFTSAAGGSIWNHFYWVTGSPGNSKSDALLTKGFDHVPTIFDRLQAAGVDWKFYIQNYDPSVSFRNPGSGDKASQIVWAPVLNYNRFLDDPELRSRIVPMEQYFTDLRNNQLPAVSYLVPSGSSEHPPGSIQAGSRFVRGLVNSLMASSAWDSSAFMWTYDDWGGWYDHVEPPSVDQYGYGFARLPSWSAPTRRRRGEPHHDRLHLPTQVHREQLGSEAAGQAGSRSERYLLRVRLRRATPGTHRAIRATPSPQAFATGHLGRVHALRRCASRSCPHSRFQGGAAAAAEGTRKRQTMTSAVRVLATAALSAVILVTGLWPADAAPPTGSVEIKTLPEVPKFPITLDDETVFTDSSGVARFETRDRRSLTDQVTYNTQKIELGGRKVRVEASRLYGESGQPVLAMDIFWPVRFSFVDVNGAPVDVSRIESVQLKSTTGETRQAAATDAVWLQGSRVVSLNGGPQNKEIQWTIQAVEYASSNVVNSAQQRFEPAKTQRVEIELLFFRSRVTVRDAFFGFEVGDAVLLTAPDDGRVDRFPSW